MSQHNNVSQMMVRRVKFRKGRKLKTSQLKSALLDIIDKF